MMQSCFSLTYYGINPCVMPGLATTLIALAGLAVLIWITKMRQVIRAQQHAIHELTGNRNLWKQLAHQAAEGEADTIDIIKHMKEVANELEVEANDDRRPPEKTP